MIVLNAEPSGYSQKAIASWKQKGFEYREAYWADIENKSYEGVSILIVRLGKKIDRITLEKFPDLTHLISATTGLDHIDQEVLKTRNIKLISLRGHNDFLQTIPSTAEHTWALLLALIRNIPAANEDVKAGNWQRDNHRGYQLKGKVLGIIGLGRTGKKVAAYANAFEMVVQYFDPFVDDTDFVKVQSLQQLLSSSDIISIHVHLDDQTEKLIGPTNTNSIKRGSLLLNTSRGKVVDETEVVKLLINGILSGVATDVLSTELEDIKDSPLWQAQKKYNIIITPHIAGATYDAMWACEEFLADQFKRDASC